MENVAVLRAFAALAHEKRLTMFRHLARVGPNGLPSGAIAKVAGVSQTSVSYHLKELDRAGLVTQTRHGRFNHYALHVEGVRHLIEFLTHDCCEERPELCGTAFTKAKNVGNGGS
jgi:ArsR family transcriptional regulator